MKKCLMLAGLCASLFAVAESYQGFYMTEATFADADIGTALVQQWSKDGTKVIGSATFSVNEYGRIDWGDSKKEFAKTEAGAVAIQALEEALQAKIMVDNFAFNLSKLMNNGGLIIKSAVQGPNGEKRDLKVSIDPAQWKKMTGGTEQFLDAETDEPIKETEFTVDCVSISSNDVGALELSGWKSRDGEGYTLASVISDDPSLNNDELKNVEVVARSGKDLTPSYIKIGTFSTSVLLDESSIKSNDVSGALQIVGFDEAYYGQIPFIGEDHSIEWDDMPNQVSYNEESDTLDITRKGADERDETDRVKLTRVEIGEDEVDSNKVKFRYANTKVNSEDDDMEEYDLFLGQVGRVSSVSGSVVENYAKQKATIGQLAYNGESMADGDVDFWIPYSMWDITGLSRGSLSGDERTYNFTGHAHDGTAIETGTLTATIKEPQTDITDLTFTGEAATDGNGVPLTKLTVSLKYKDKEGNQQEKTKSLTVNGALQANGQYAVDGLSIDDSGYTTGTNSVLQIHGFKDRTACGEESLAKMIHDNDSGLTSHHIITRFGTGGSADIHYLPIGQMPRPKVDDGVLHYVDDVNGMGEFKVSGGEAGQLVTADSNGDATWSDLPLVPAQNSSISITKVEDHWEISGGGGGITNLVVNGTSGSATGSTINLGSADDSNVSVDVSGDGNGTVTVKFGVHYK